ncbi:hypothetical protein UFOVP1623_7 [uncultured Caudovirales phage]|uniref:Uncharacterized protein n=1 Tax=uncultured Caudovirales phage TaxID=2100421 RepID=A0A6J5SYV5_9CAUD|nr:hypothetical protein UFOVP1376_2 [uncultured Caudovirales phage]CAB4220628.1 hypothetical protein UFOVP1623_7 [uncultured Caudovirales phage]
MGLLVFQAVGALFPEQRGNGRQIHTELLGERLPPPQVPVTVGMGAQGHNLLITPTSATADNVVGLHATVADMLAAPLDHARMPANPFHVTRAVNDG